MSNTQKATLKKNKQKILKDYQFHSSHPVTIFQLELAEASSHLKSSHS